MANSAARITTGEIDQLEFLRSYRECVDQAEMVLIADLEHRLIYVNDKLCEVSGYRREELIGQHERILLPDHSGDPEFEKGRITLALGYAWEGDIVQRTKDGLDYWVASVVIPRCDDSGRVTGYVAINREITDRKKRELRLARSNRWLQNFLDRFPGGAVSIDGSDVAFNRCVEEITGYSNDEILDVDMWYGIIFGPRRDEILESLKDKRFQGQTSDFSMPILRKDGRTRHVQFRITHHGSSEIWMLVDLTERISAEERFRILFEQSSNAHLLMANGKVIDCNAAAVRALGYDSKFELLGKSTVAFSPELQANGRPSLDLASECMRIVQSRGSHRFEWLHQRKDGSEFPVEVSLTQIDVDHEPAILSVWHDRTEERRAQEQLLHQAKMVSLGEMAAGLAHEINNPLAIIKGRSEQLRELLNLGNLDLDRVARFANQIDQTVDRIARIIAGLRDFARDGSNEPFRPANVGDVIEETLTFCQTRFRTSSIELRLAVDSPEQLSVECRAIEISQVILNLLNNAYDAVKETRQGHLGGWVEIAARGFADRVEIAVTDNGPGIAKELRARIMQPFFTTKEVGKGTGLGLSTSQGIVHAHGGQLTLDEECPHTRFVVSLPRRPAQKQTPSAA